MGVSPVADRRVRRYFVVPRAELQAYVDRLWGWESPFTVALPPMLPGTGAELLFHYGQPFAIAGTARGLVEPGAGQLLCARRSPHRLLAQGRVGFIAVRFRSGALRHFASLPLAELENDALSVGDVWGAHGSDVAERVALAGSRAQRVDLIERWLLACLVRHRKDQPALEAALRALYYRHDSITIDMLAGDLGMSRRHFERVFGEQIGVTPKAFQRTARFNHTLRELLLTEPRATLATALDHGYYDQAHFIRDFRSFVGESPQSYLRQARSSSHFYNQPLFAPDKVPLPR